MVKIYAVVVTYNGMKWIEECLSSLYNSSLLIDIVLIDNDSSDQTVSCIKSKFPDVILFEQKQNLGFGKANNIGIAHALKQKADFVFLLNQDAFVEKNAIELLTKVSLNRPEYGILSPVQLDYSGKLLENYFFKFMADDNSRTFYSDFVINSDLKEIYDIDFIQAAAWLLPVSTIKKTGGFDPIFYHYGEDNNYCHRIIYHNLKIGVVPKAFIRHDSRVKSQNQEKDFSEKYFKDYCLALSVKYCNINIEFTDEQIRKDKNKIYRSILKSLIILNFSNILGFYKKLRLFESSIINIEQSRKINKQSKTNHLDE